MQDKGKLVLQSRAFALSIISTYKYLCTEHREYVLSRQLLRSGTAIGAMIAEAQHAESGADFIHKYAIAQKETAETSYWLDLLGDSSYLEQTLLLDLKERVSSLSKMLSSAILTRKENLRTSKTK